MTTKTKFAAVFMSAAMLFGMAACAQDNRVECDKNDQVEFDSDCGYYENGQFVWYSWVVRGQTSYSPEGWEKPAQANHDEDSEHKKSKPKKKITTKPKAVTNPGYKAPSVPLVKNKPVVKVPTFKAPAAKAPTFKSPTRRK